MSQPTPHRTPPATPRVLVIEISNPTACDHAAFVALGTVGGVLVDHEPLNSEAGGRDDLHPAIDRLTARAGVSPRDLERVAVSAGPGGYTGLRVAVAAALLLAEAVGAELVSIPTARLVARSVPPGGYPRGIALASKGEACHLTIENSRDELTEVGMIRAEQLDRFGLIELIADAHLPGMILKRAHSLGASVIEPVFLPRSACTLASELDQTHPSQMTVHYAREPDAVTQWRTRHERR